MLYKVLFSELARKDLQEIYDWYEDQQTGVGEKFLDAFDRTVEKISLTPTAGTIKYDEIRCRLVKHFPYLIHY